MTQRVAYSLLRHYQENEAQILHVLTGHRNIHVYMRVIERILARDPCDEAAPDLEALSAEDAARVTAAVRAALECVEAGQGSLADVEAALQGAVFSEEAPGIR